MADKDVLIKVSAQDDASAKLEGIFDNLKSKAVAIGAGIELFSIGKEAIDNAMKFEDQMTRINIKLEDTELTNKYAKEISDLATKSSVPLDELADGFYDIVRSNIAAEDRMEVLRASADLVQVGMGDLGQSLDLVTKYMKIYNIDASESENVASKFFIALQRGNTTVEEMANTGFPDLITSAKNIGVSGNDLVATFTALTSSGLSTGDSVGALNRIFHGVMKEGDVLNTALQNLGVEGFDELVVKEGGLAPALSSIMTELDKNGVSAMSAFKGVDTYNALLALSSEEGGTMQKYKDVLNELSTGTGTFTESVELANSTTADAWDTVKNKYSVALKDLGTASLPAVSLGLSILSAFITAASELFSAMGDRFKEVFSFMKTMLGDFIDSWKWLIDVVGRAISKVKDFLGINSSASNSGVFTEMTAGASIGFRANGGGVSESSPYVVGERGPEMFVPSNSGRIIPSTNNGITLNVNVSGNSVGNADELASIVSNKIMQTLKFNTQVM